MAKDQNRRYIWLLRTLIETGGISLKELCDRWERSSENDDHKELKRRTFFEHKDAVERMFDVNIICKVIDGQYKYLVEDADLASRDNLYRWLLESASVSNTLSDCKDIRDRIILEPIAGGTQYLAVIVEAIRESKVLEVIYQSYGMTEPRTFTLHPYSLKNWQHRWYLLATNVEKNTLRKYELSRMHKVTKKAETFKIPKGFNPLGYYDDCIGIRLDEGTVPEKIVLRVYKGMQPYFESCPLHHSQTKVDYGDDYTDYQYRLVVNNDLYRQLLALEDQVEVMEPKSLREQMKIEALRILKRYDK